MHRSGGCSIKLPFRRFHVLSYFPERDIRVKRTRLHRTGSDYFGRGDFGLYPAGESEEIEWHGRKVHALHIHISPRLVQHHCGKETGHRFHQVQRRFRFRDPTLAVSADSLHELGRQWPQDQRAAEVLINAIARHLAVHYTNASTMNQPMVGALPISDLLDRMHGQASVTHDLDALTRLTGMPRSSFHRRFRRIIGCSPHDYLLRSRIEMSKAQLQRGARPLADIAIETGFFDQAHYGNAFKKRIGLSPGAFMDLFSQN